METRQRGGVPDVPLFWVRAGADEQRRKSNAETSDLASTTRERNPLPDGEASDGAHAAMAQFAFPYIMAPFP